MKEPIQGPAYPSGMSCHRDSSIPIHNLVLLNLPRPIESVSTPVHIPIFYRFSADVPR